MRYTPATAYALMLVAVLCFVVGAPPWMFLATGVAAVALGIVGIRQVRGQSSGGGSDDEAPGELPAEDESGGAPR